MMHTNLHLLLLLYYRKIASHVADLDAFLRGLSDAGDGTDANNSYTLGFKLGENPQIVLLGHSFGGLTIMKWLEQKYEEKDTEIGGEVEVDTLLVSKLSASPTDSTCTRYFNVRRARTRCLGVRPLKEEGERRRPACA